MWSLYLVSGQIQLLSAPAVLGLGVAAHRGQTQPLSLSAVISCLTLLPQAFPERCVGLRHLGVVGATLAPAEVGGVNASMPEPSSPCTNLALGQSRPP